MVYKLVGAPLGKSSRSSPITTIITTSPIPSHPTCVVIDEVFKSLKMVPMLYNGPIIVACDGSPTKNDNYENYKRVLGDKINRLPNGKMVSLNRQGYLSGNVKNAMKHVDTKYVMVIQHDFPFLYSFDPNHLVGVMERHPEVKLIRFNKRSNNQAVGVDSKIEERCFENLCLTKTNGWSDNNHFTTKKYYDTLVLPNLNNVKCMEMALMGPTKIDPDKYGVYLYGPMSNGPMIKHVDGREVTRAPSFKF